MNAALIITLLFSVSVHASFLPPEEVQNQKFFSTIAPNEHAEKVKDKIINLYKDEFSIKGQILSIQIDWHDSNVNASATYDHMDQPSITITGGMAGHPLIDENSLAMVICHEIGHFLGGLPKQLRGRSGKISWSSAEGQADYYAASYCIKKYSEFTADKQLLTSASLKVAKIYAMARGKDVDLNLNRPSPLKVYQTILTHPDPQCRLDTMLAGLHCPDSLEIDFSSADPKEHSCKRAEFGRPACWFSSEDFK